MLLRLKSIDEIIKEFGNDFSYLVVQKNYLDVKFKSSEVDSNILPHQQGNIRLFDENNQSYLLPSKIFDFVSSVEKEEVLSKLSSQDKFFYLLKRNSFSENNYGIGGTIILKDSFINIYYSPTANCQLSSIGNFEALFTNYSNDDIKNIILAIKHKYIYSLSNIIFVDVKDRNSNYERLNKFRNLYVNKYNSTNNSKMITALLTI